MKTSLVYRMMKLARHIAGWSKDPSTKVGAVIVDDLGRVVGMGFNGFPRHVADNEERYENRDVKYKMIVHAEVNAILNSLKEPRGCKLFSTFHPCAQCAAMIIQAGITEVYAPASDDERWEADRKIARTMFHEAKVLLTVMD